MRMLDWDGQEYQISDSETARISTAQTHSALRTENLTFAPKEGFVRDCFDSLFGGLEQIEHQISVSLIVFSDVDGALAYYANLMAKNVFNNSLFKYGYQKAPSFLDRVLAWNDDYPGSALDCEAPPLTARALALHYAPLN